MSNYPICFIKHTPEGILVHSNVFRNGNNGISYRMENTDKVHSSMLKSEDTELKDFAEGIGNYFFFTDSAKQLANKAYIPFQNQEEETKRIVSYIDNPSDEKFLNECVRKCKEEKDFRKESFWLTFQFASIYEKSKSSSQKNIRRTHSMSSYLPPKDTRTCTQ